MAGCQLNGMKSYHCVGMDRLENIASNLQIAVSFLSEFSPRSRLEHLEDWTDSVHVISDKADGIQLLPSEPKVLVRAISFKELEEQVSNPRTIYEWMIEEEGFFVGIQSFRPDWYLRYRAQWDSSDTHLEGLFDLTLPMDIAEIFEQRTLPELPCLVETR